jgi:hypothetical protein
MGALWSTHCSLDNTIQVLEEGQSHEAKINGEGSCYFRMTIPEGTFPKRLTAGPGQPGTQHSESNGDVKQELNVDDTKNDEQEDSDEDYLSGYNDVLVTITTQSGVLDGVFISPHERFPAANRKIWQQETICNCTQDGCDHGFPNCVRVADGVLCSACCNPRGDFHQVQHDLTLATAWASVTAEQVVDSHRFAIRLNCADVAATNGVYNITVSSESELAQVHHFSVKYEIVPRMLPLNQQIAIASEQQQQQQQQQQEQEQE